MLDRLIFRPTLKLGSAAIKDLSTPRKTTYQSSSSSIHTPTSSNQIKSTSTYISNSHGENNKKSSTTNNSNSTRASAYSPDAQERIDKRRCGLDQCKNLSALLYKLSLDKSINPEVLSGVSKIHVIINKYLDKGVLCGMDLYTFADEFCAEQILKLKTEKSRTEYSVARKALIVISSGYSYDTIVDYLQTLNIA